MRLCIRLQRIFRLHTHTYSTDMSKRIAVCQMTSVADKAQNLTVVSQLINDATKEDVQMIFFPEACDYICDNKKDIVKLSEPLIGGSIVSKYRDLAAKHDVWLSMGGVHEKDDTNPSKMYNTHVIINNKGDIVQTYRKLHLFNVEIPEKNVRLKESDFSHQGGHVVTPVDTPIGRIGMAICYDMRFPELSTALSTMGAEILTYPSAFTETTGQAHWHVLLMSRAIENQCYVIAAAQSGAHNAKRKSYGHALCVDPWGVTLADCGKDSPSYKVVEIRGEKLKEVRRNMPVFQHRRRDMYSLYCLSLRKDLLPIHKDNSTPTASETQSPQIIPISPQISPDSPHSSPTSPLEEQNSNVFGHVRIPESCVFYKSERSYAFVNLRCVIPGHVLVAPLRPAKRNQDLDEDEAQDFYSTIRLVQRLMEKVHNTQSCTVTIQDGPDAGQTVKHLHCHIMPRKKGDFIENDHIYLELAKHDKSRAIENQCYVIAAAQSGAHNAKRKSYGHALCVDPWGVTLADCGKDSPSYKVVEIRGEKLKEVRRNMPVFQHRRRDMYSLYCLSLRKDLLPIHKDNSTPTASETQSPQIIPISPQISPDSPHSSPTSPLEEQNSNVFGHVRIPESCVFYKSERSYAFVNLRCVIPGHVLVAPLRPAKRNQDLDEDEAQDFYSTIRLVQRLMEKVHNTQSCTVTIQDGPDAGQTVKHLHCHIMPRKKGDFIENDHIYLELAKHDNFKSGHPAKPPRSLEEMQQEADLLRKEMNVLLKDMNINS